MVELAVATMTALVAMGALSAAQAAVPTSFVVQSGSDLELDGKPFRFTGINVYNANNSTGCWYPLAGG